MLPAAEVVPSSQEDNSSKASDSAEVQTNKEGALTSIRSHYQPMNLDRLALLDILHRRLVVALQEVLGGKPLPGTSRH